MAYDKVHAIDLPNGGEDIYYNLRDLKKASIEYAKEYGREIYFYVYYYYDSGNMKSDWYTAYPNGTIIREAKRYNHDN
jgi:hypothetical protein